MSHRRGLNCQILKAEVVPSIVWGGQQRCIKLGMSHRRGLNCRIWKRSWQLVRFRLVRFRLVRFTCTSQYHFPCRVFLILARFNLKSGRVILLEKKIELARRDWRAPRYWILSPSYKHKTNINCNMMQSKFQRIHQEASFSKIS